MRRALAALAAAAGFVAAVPGALGGTRRPRRGRRRAVRAAGRGTRAVPAPARPRRPLLPRRPSPPAWRWPRSPRSRPRPSAASAARSRMLRVSRRLQVVLNALVVELPQAQEARLQRLPGIRQVYQSWSYAASTDRVPTVIDAVPLWGHGARHARWQPGRRRPDRDHRRRDRHLPAVLRAPGLQLPAGVPQGHQGVDQRQGHRRPLVPAARPVDSRGAAGVRPQRLRARHPRPGIAAGNAGITGITAGDVRVPCLSGVAPGPTSATTAC